MHKKCTQTLCTSTIDKHTQKVYNIDKLKRKEMNKMPTFPNEYQPDNTDDRELAEYAAELLREINANKEENHEEQ